MKTRIFVVTVCLAAMFWVLPFGGPMAAHSEEGWQERKGNHFIVYYKNAPPDFVKSVEEMAEYYYGEITRIGPATFVRSVLGSKSGRLG